MTRTKTFDPTKALARAMTVFWRLGYERASVDVLLREMGIAKQSLYDTFGDKRALYLKALACYRDQANERMRAGLSRESVGQGWICQALIGNQHETRAQHARGCLILSANLERDTADAAIAEFLRDNQARVESIFVDSLRRGQATGELPATHDRRTWLATW